MFSPKGGVENPMPQQQMRMMPKWIGSTPYAVIMGSRTGVTSMMVGEELDAGDILLSKATPIGEGETYGELQERLAPLGAQLLLETVSAIEAQMLMRHYKGFLE